MAAIITLSFVFFMAVLVGTIWFSVQRNRRGQQETEALLLQRKTEIMAGEEERQRLKEQEGQLLQMGAIDMMTTYLQRIGASTQLAAWVSRAQVEVANAEMAGMSLFFLPLETLIETTRRVIVNGKELARPRRKEDVRKEHVGKVTKGTLRAITEAFASLPTLQTFVVSAYTPPPGSEQAVFCAISVRVNRSVLQVVRDLERGSPLEILRQFELHMDLQPENWALGEIKPFELDSPPAPRPPVASASPPVPVPPMAPPDAAQQKFEATLEKILQEDGIRVVNRMVRSDGTLILQATSERAGAAKVFLCCRRTRDPIDADEVTRFKTDMAAARAAKLYFLTTSTFSLDAMKVAMEHQIELLDGAKLNLLWKKSQEAGG